jgi:ferredoxin
MKHIQVVDTSVKGDLMKFGARDWHECYQCGNCTALCPLSEDGSLFPRRVIKQAQMGMKRSLMQNEDPWLCYYCGECSASCPRDANPAELMMSMRRYLTSLYDWTGLSRRFYMDHRWELGAILLMAAGIIALFAIFSPPQNVGVNEQGGVLLNSFAPIHWIETGDLIMAVLVAALLVSNILHMYYRVILSAEGLRIPLSAYFSEFWKLVWHFGTQARFSKCDTKSKKYWYSHWLLMSGYTIMFVVVVGFLPWFQTETIHPLWHPQRLLGYYATFGLLFGLTYVIIGRFRRKDEKFRYSHISDWIFIVMLLLTTVSGILVHIFRIYGLPMATYYTYVFHLAVLVPMIMVEVPFSKWSHLAYRPFAIYFHALKARALGRKAEQDVYVSA